MRLAGISLSATVAACVAECRRKSQNIAALVPGRNRLARLEFAKNLIFDNGGDRCGEPRDPALIASTEILDQAIKILKKHPRAARLQDLVL